ncbi:MAG: glycosyltransferase N-terminal domain-containing protein [Pseudomonadota bacterium]
MSFSLALSGYLVLSRLLDAPVRVLLRRRLARGKEDPARIGERRGFPGVDRPDGRLVWLHGASIGEAMSILPLVAAVKRVAPDAICLVTTGTVTSAKRMAEMLPDGAIHQFVPVDTAAATRRFLDHWRPDAAVWVESEFWPRLMHNTAARGIPMALVNARVSAASARRWSRLPRMIAALLRMFRLIVTQDRETAERLEALAPGHPALRVGGNLKALAPLPPPEPDDLARANAAINGRPVWLAASTHPGEEEILLETQRRLGAPVLMILAIRHPERGDAVEAMIEAAGLGTARASRGEMPGSGTDVWLADTLGQMGLWLRLAPVTFVGGSLMEVGGHTPFEPALMRSAILHGPHTANFAPAYAALHREGAARQVSNAEELGRAVAALLGDASMRDARADAAMVLFRDAPDPEALMGEILTLASEAD